MEIDLAGLADETSLPIREDIVVSWFRSVRHGVRQECLAVPYDDGADPDSRLVRAARPVLQELAEDLAGTMAGLVLADGRGCVVERHVPDAELRARFDRIELAPQARYSEDAVGTNAIGTALVVERPVAVIGGEHFVDALSTMACAAVPLTDPTGSVLGVVDLTSTNGGATPLMMPFVKRAAREIEHRLIDGAPAAEGRLREQFLRARRRTRDPLVAVNAETMLANAVASAMVGPGDQERLWDWVSRSTAGRRPVAPVVDIATGPCLVTSFEPLVEGGRIVGATLRLQPEGDASPNGGPPRGPLGAGNRPRFGWDSLTGAELRVAELVARGMTNRQVGAELYMSPHTVGFHLRQVYRKLGVASRVEMTALVVQRRCDR